MGCVRCPDCGERLIFAAIAGGTTWLPAWICDCKVENDSLAELIVEAREQGAALMIPLGSRDIRVATKAALN